MLPLRYAARWRVTGLLFLVIVLLASMMPAGWLWPDRQEFVSWFTHADKWMHGIVFATLAVWFAGQYSRGSYWRIAVGLLAFGVLIEACQRLVGYRTSEWLDVAADAAGIAVGLAIALAGLGGWSQWIENRLVRSKVATSGD
ncbi:MAG: VanZ family protein [Woeseiaceae bacterium]|nr:VanZ family protein [Woeseiaceae bacterium]